MKKSLIFMLLVAILLTSFTQVSVLAAGDTDLALKKTVSASGVWDDVPEEAAKYQPQFANDGDDTTRWAGKADEDEGLFWFIVDLGEVKTVNKLVVKFELASTYDIESSTDGKEFKSIETELTATSNLKDGEELGVDETTFSPVSARYIRLISVSYMSIWSLSVYGNGGQPAQTTKAPSGAATTPDKTQSQTQTQTQIQAQTQAPSQTVSEVKETPVKTTAAPVATATTVAIATESGTSLSIIALIIFIAGIVLLAAIAVVIIMLVRKKKRTR